ncbi:MAG TPA: FMN-binding protein [Planctomycetota bacterium]|nr:FMN-binding protein [Planctomycetota bacterium]
MRVSFNQWVAGVLLTTTLAVLPAAETAEPTGSGSHATAAAVDQQHAAEQAFSETYGKDEQAALASADGADNITLAETLFTDSEKPADNPALAGVLRSHAASLLFRSGDKSACDLALELEKAALASDQSEALPTAEALVQVLEQGLKELPPADRAPLPAKLVSLYQTIVGLQIQAHRADQAVVSLTKLTDCAKATDDKQAAQAADNLFLVLQPLAANAATLAKDLAALEHTPDDKQLNTEVALVLLCDWGEVSAAAPSAAKGEPLQVQGLAEMAQYEAGGRSVGSLSKLAIRKLAESYETWAKDSRDSKLGHLILSQRAAELYQVVAAAAKAGPESQAAKTAEALAADAIRYAQDAGPLIAAIKAANSSAATLTAPRSTSTGSGIVPPGQKSPEEVQKIIATVGPTDPDWLAAAELDYPQSLDLTWGMPKGGANRSKMLGQYIWSTLNENPSQWQSGIKLMYKVMDVNKDNPAKLNLTYQTLGRMYFNYFKDYARAAYYWQKAGSGDHLDMQHCSDNVSLAHCYFALGNAEMARKILEGYPTDNTPHGAIINAWGEFGDVTQALKMADAAIDAGRQFIGYPAGGDVCRRAGRYDEALKYYEGFLNLKNLAGVNKSRAREAYDTIKFFNLFDLSKVPDGTFKSSSAGFRGPVQSAVTVKDHKIVDIQVKHREDQCYSSITDIPAQIMEKQTVRGIDGCSGATVTSNAIIMGAAKALGNAAQP